MVRALLRQTLLVLIGVSLLQGCASPSRREAVPLEQRTEAVIPGMPRVRYLIDLEPEAFVRDALETVALEKRHLAAQGQRGPLPPAHFLAISGGGDNGAFGAGLLVGWSETGSRPVFNAVTGVSTGALIAPFAFLGPAYDRKLQAVYTTISADDIFEKRSILAALFDDALADNTPLWGLIRRHIDREMLAAIAAEHRKGRWLLVATANLDFRQPVVWNMGAIAASGHPGALELFHSILIASAAIPGAFPPVMIDVEVAGKRYQEMHVDGGTIAQAFLYPSTINLGKIAREQHLERERRLYVIRNARTDPDWASVERQTLSIVGRAIASLIHTQGIGDLYQIYLNAQRDGLDYNLAVIPPDFTAVHREEFDTEYMGQLFHFARRLARRGYPWQKLPPGYVTN